MPTARHALRLQVVAGFLAALLIGFLVTKATYSDTHRWLVLAPLAALLLLWLGVIVRLETLVIVLVGSVVFHGYLTVDVGFTVLPAYAVVVIALMRSLPVRGLRIPSTPVAAPLKLFVLVAAISVPVALEFGGRLPAIAGDLRYGIGRPAIQFAVLLLMLSGFYVTATLLSRRRELYVTGLKALLIASTAVSIYALYQQLAHYVGLPTLAFLGEPRLVPSFTLSPSVSVYRSSGTFTEPLNLGHFLIGTLSLLLSLYIARSNIGSFRRWIGPMIVINGAAFVSTFSSGAFMGMVGAVLVFVFAGKRRIFSSMLLGLAVAIGLAIASILLVTVGSTDTTAPEFLSRRALETYRIETLPQSPRNPYIGIRRSDYWRASIHMAEERPLTGVGIGNFGRAAVAINPRLIPEAGSYGAVSGILGELGIPGLVILLFFVARFAGSCRRAFARSADHPELMGFLAGFIGMMVQYIPSGYTRMDMHFWVFVGLATAGVVHALRGNETSPATIAKRFDRAAR